MLEKLPRWALILVGLVSLKAVDIAVPYIFHTAEKTSEATAAEIKTAKTVAYEARTKADQALAGVEGIKKGIDEMKALDKKFREDYRDDRIRDEEHRRQDQASINSKLDLIIRKT